MMKLYFRAASVVAPRAVERQAAALFFMPRRRAKAALPAEWRRITVERLAVWTTGYGPTVLLIHGWEGSAADFVPLATSLAAKGYRAALVDLPAHGRSRGRSTTLPECMRALSMVADALGGVHAVVGHSFGAMATALAVAENHVAAQRVVLFAPVATPEQYIRPFSRMIGLPAARAHGVRRRIEQRVGRSVESFDVRQAVRYLAVPSLIFHAPQDRVAEYSYAREIAEAWPGCRLVAREGQGHRRLLADPDAIAETVEFLRTATTAPILR